jgi:hypothetical protein
VGADEEWRSQVTFVQQRLDELRQKDVDSRTLCGQLDRGWMRWSAERLAQHRQLVRDLWDEQSPQVPRQGKAFFVFGIDTGDKIAALCKPDFFVDPDQYLVVDAFWIEDAMAKRKMIPQIDGLSPMEASALIHEEAWELAERLAQRAYSEKCNVLWVITGGKPDGTDADQRPRHPDDTVRALGEDTVRALIERYEHGGIEFSALVADLVSRWHTRPGKNVGPADWAEVYRAKDTPEDDDLFWVSVAEDLGTLTLEQAEHVFTAIEHAAGERRSDISSAEGDNDDGTKMRRKDEAITHWRYFADNNQVLIRVPVTDGIEGRGERYWGHSAGWMTTSPCCADWADETRNSPRYRPVNEAEVAPILEHIDQQPGGVFWDFWRFWDDLADRWSTAQARERVAKLKDAIADTNNYWTWYEYRADRDEMSRLQAFIDQKP